jgi:hypothetical protein
LNPTFLSCLIDVGPEALRITGNVSARGDNVLVNGDAVLAVKAGIKFEFVDYILAKLGFFHDLPP